MTQQTWRSRLENRAQRCFPSVLSVKAFITHFHTKNENISVWRINWWGQIIISQAAVFIHSFDEKRLELLTGEPPLWVSVYCFGFKLFFWLVSGKNFFLKKAPQLRKDDNSLSEICRQLFLLITSTPVTLLPLWCPLNPPPILNHFLRTSVIRLLGSGERACPKK